MQDRELLELAAKAAGYQVEWVKNSGCYYRCEEEIGREQWDPLEDDGDALRLAVKLRITPRVHLQGYSVAVTAQCIVDSYTEICGDDEMAATRRAIVRAAAEIGKNI
jgi:hypothetical protein